MRNPETQPEMSSADFSNTVASQCFTLPIVKKARGYRRRRLASNGSEEIWSDLAHTAFMEALVVYPPMGKSRLKDQQASPGIASPNLDSRPPKAFGRHQLIQSFIYKKTGKVRTTQQISSHIQRLKNRHRHNPAFMALLASSSSSLPGTSAGLDRFDIPIPSTPRDVFPLLAHDLALENAGGALHVHGLPYNFFPGPLCLPEQATQNKHEVTGPVLQEDVINVFEPFDLKAQNSPQPNPIANALSDSHNTSTIYQERPEFERQTQFFPVAFLGELSASFKDQDLHILPSNYCTTSVTPAHTPVYPLETSSRTGASITTLSLSQIRYL